MSLRRQHHHSPTAEKKSKSTSALSQQGGISQISQSDTHLLAQKSEAFPPTIELPNGMHIRFWGLADSEQEVITQSLLRITGYIDNSLELLFQDFTNGWGIGSNIFRGVDTQKAYNRLSLLRQTLRTKTIDILHENWVTAMIEMAPGFLTVSDDSLSLTRTSLDATILRSLGRSALSTVVNLALWATLTGYVVRLWGELSYSDMTNAFGITSDQITISTFGIEYGGPEHSRLNQIASNLATSIKDSIYWLDAQSKLSNNTRHPLTKNLSNLDFAKARSILQKLPLTDFSIYFHGNINNRYTSYAFKHKPIIVMNKETFDSESNLMNVIVHESIHILLPGKHCKTIQNTNSRKEAEEHMLTMRPALRVEEAYFYGAVVDIISNNTTKE